MANIKISQLPAKGANLASTDLVEISEFNGSGYVSKSITGQEIIDAASGGSGVTDVTATAPLSSTGGSTPDIAITQAGAADDGYLSTGDWNAFNNKQDALSSGVNIKTINGSSVLGSGDLTISGGGGGNVIPAPPITGLYYMTTANMNFADGHNLYANELTFNPFRPMNNFNVNQFNIEVTQLFAGQNARVVIYSDLNGKPSSKLYESTNIDISTTGYKTVTMSYSFAAGTLYWIGIQGSLNGGRLRSVLVTNTMLAWSVSATASTAYSTLIYTSLIFGSLPATIPPATAIYQGSAGPFVLKFRAA